MKTRIIAIIALSIALGTADAALTTNLWISGSGKWEDGANWNQGVPSSDDAVNNITVGLAGTTTIDTATVTQHVINSCMTISNLVVGGPVPRILFLNNANDTPGNIGLTILNSFTISGSGSLVITNSRLRMTGGGFLTDNNTILLNAGSVNLTNIVTEIGYGANGALTISNGTWSSIGFNETDVGGSIAGSVGTLTVAGGVATFAFAGLDIARVANTTGAVWVTGGQMTANQLIPGCAGVGQMTISNGTCFGGTIQVGLFFGAEGTFTVAGGTNTFTEYLSVGDQAGATGAVWITGGQLTMTNNATLIGGLGVGQMTVSNGTWRINAISAGSFPGSVGTLTIAGGTNTFITSTSVSFPNYLDVGRDAAATGAVWVTGGQLIMTNIFAQIGKSGVGQMTVSNGTWMSSALRVGTNPGSQGTLTVAGGTNMLTGTFSLGDQPGATGALWVSGGQLVAQSSFDVGLNGVGQMTASNGNVQLSGLDIAPNGGAKGTFTMAGGSTVLGLGGLTVGFSPDSTGAVWMTGGQLIGTNGDTFVGGGSGRITVSNGNWRASNVFLGIYLGGAGTMTAVGGVSAMTNLVLGDCAFDIQGFLLVKGGSVLVTNAAGNAVLDVRNGYVALDAG